MKALVSWWRAAASVCHNRVAKVSEQICNLGALEVLALQHNRISHLPQTFGRLVSLTELQLNHNRLAACTWLPQLTSLVHLGALTRPSCHKSPNETLY